MMNTIGSQVRTLLAKELDVQEQTLTDDYRWLDAIGSEDAEYFLAELNDRFTKLRSGFSLGEGERPFDYITPERLERIATVGALITHIERHVGRA
jgi:cell division FtsZ-interacting protein ZapD